MGHALTLAPEVEERLNRTAIRKGVSKDRLAEEAIRTYLESVDPNVPDNASEADLLMAINQGFSADFWTRFGFLASKRDNYSISSDELSELIELSTMVEHSSARRLGYLIKLAALRRTDVQSLMKELDLRPRDAQTTTV